MKFFILSGMLVWPAWASVAGSAHWVDAALVTVAILVVGLVLGWMFPDFVASLAITGIAGGVVGVLVGLFYGVARGYWVGAGMSVGFVVASVVVVAFCRRRASEGSHISQKPSVSVASGQPRNPAWTLPPAPRDLYMPDELPSTEVGRMYNVEWLEKEMALGTFTAAFDQANLILRGHPKEDRISSVTSALTKHVQSLMRDRAVATAAEADLIYAVWLGVGFGLLEEVSGLRMPDVVHPSIWNGMTFADSLGDRATQPKEVRLVLTKAMEGGYSAERHNLMTPDEVFAGCDFGGATRPLTPL